jgi:hypothetical protein
MEKSRLQRFMRGRIAWAILAAAVLTAAAVTAGLVKP